MHFASLPTSKDAVADMTNYSLITVAGAAAALRL